MEERRKIKFEMILDKRENKKRRMKKKREKSKLRENTVFEIKQVIRSKYS